MTKSHLGKATLTATQWTQISSNKNRTFRLSRKSTPKRTMTASELSSLSNQLPQTRMKCTKSSRKTICRNLNSSQWAVRQTNLSSLSIAIPSSRPMRDRWPQINLQLAIELADLKASESMTEPVGPSNLQSMIGLGAQNSSQ